MDNNTMISNEKENLSIDNQKQNVQQTTSSVIQTGNPAEPEEVIGENDIVIEEDFQINMDIATVSDPAIFSDSETKEDDKENGETEIGTEQSGKIMF